MAKKREYLNDFKLNEQGKYEYVGTLHKLDETSITYKKAKNILVGLDFLVLFVYVLAGCVRAVGVMNSIYVTAPYVFAMFGIAVLTFKIVMLYIGRYPIRDYDFKSTVLKLRGYSLLTLVLSIATLIGELYYIIRYGVEMYLTGTIVFVLCIVVSILGTLALIKFIDKLHWIEM